MRCENCGKESRTISSSLPLCPSCIKKHFNDVLPVIEEAHRRSREPFGLPPSPPREGERVCRLCVNECRIPEGGVSYCGTRRVVNGSVKGASATLGNLSYYYDPLPTNCVAEWVCAGGTGSGFPKYAYKKGPETGYKNLAVFYESCSFDCLFCQNWHFRRNARRSPFLSAEELAGKVDSKTSCICYFGGDPTPQLPHSILTSEIALKNSKNRILRICWETNGSMNEKALHKMAKIALESGGCIKFDLKAFSEELHIALCGVTNRRTLSNFKLLSRYMEKRPEPPFLIASTLLVPGYIDEEEVYEIARFISSLNPNIPYSLLAFYPQFMMGDLPRTSFPHALRCYDAAKRAGLKRVKIGNIHLLGGEYG